MAKKTRRKRRPKYTWETVEKLPKGEFYRVFSENGRPVLKRLKRRR